MEQKEVIYILCEGDSEVGYITKLNKFLDNGNYNFIFHSNNLHGCLKSKTSPYSKIVSNFEEFSKGIKGQFLIWLDEDMFKRGQLKENILKNKLKKFISIHRKVEIIYSTQNFEDFLSMHLEQELFEKWEEICLKQNHFNNPMISTVYEPLMKTIIKDYSKGKLPSEIYIDDSIIERLKNRQDDKNFHAKCDLINFIVYKLKCL